MKSRYALALCELPTQRVLATAGADDKDFHDRTKKLTHSSFNIEHNAAGRDCFHHVTTTSHAVRLCHTKN